MQTCEQQPQVFLETTRDELGSCAANSDICYFNLLANISFCTAPIRLYIIVRDYYGGDDCNEANIAQ